MQTKYRIIDINNIFKITYLDSMMPVSRWRALDPLSFAGPESSQCGRTTPTGCRSYVA
eukprot:SAG31_NODE_35067_length_326_cov_1.145374_1_plen_57_part_01